MPEGTDHKPTVPPGTDALSATGVALRALGVAAAYFLAGRAALLLAIPPGYAASFWPAAGIAVGAVLLWGRGMVPGIFLGSLTVNLWIGADAIQAGNLAAVASAVVIAGGASLQALAGAVLARRVTHSEPRLGSAQSISAVLLATGPVACTINATMGPGVLLIGGIVSPGEFSFNWWNWWIGDTIGVVVVTPLLLIWSGAVGRDWRARRLHVTMPILVAVGVVVTAFVTASNREFRRIETEFRSTASAATVAVQYKLGAVLDTLTSLRSLYDSSRFVTRDEFRLFTGRLLAAHPEISALSWNPLVDHEQRGILENSPDPAGGSTLTVIERNVHGIVIPAEPAERYVVVQHIEPFSGNEAAVGFNVYSEPVRRAAIHRAWETGEIASTGAIQLVQSSEPTVGMLLFAPIMSSAPNADPQGFVVAVVLVRNLLEKALAGIAHDDFALQLIDLGEAGPLVLSTLGAQLNAGDAVFTTGTDLEFGGRRLRVEMSAGNDYVARHRAPGLWFVLAGGLLMSGMLGAFLMVLTGHTLRERRRVIELKGLNTRLAEHMAWRRRFESELSREKAHAEATLNSIADGVITVTDDGVVDYMNPVAELLTGWPLAEARGKPIAEVFTIHAEDEFEVDVDPVALCLAHESDDDALGDLWLRSRDGTEYAIRQSVSRLRVPEGAGGLVIAFQDITEARRLARAMRHQATHDALTGLVNRAEFQTRLARSLTSARERNVVHSVCFMDLDHFKKVNDTAGHEIGDELLRGICERIRAHVRGRDTLARLGGDEFALLLEYCPPRRALEIAEQVIADVSQFELPWQDRSFSVGISIGIVGVDSAAVDAAELMRRADMACYTAKDLGRNRAHLAGKVVSDSRRRAS